MILTKRQQQDAGFNPKFPSNYMVLNTEHLQYSDDIRKFSNAVEVLNVINRIEWINDACKSIGSPLRIESGIFYKIINSIFTGAEFTEREIDEFGTQLQRLEQYTVSLMKITDTGKSELGYELPLDPCLSISGLPINEQDQLSGDCTDALHEEYVKYFIDLSTKRITTTEYMVKVKEVIGNVRAPKTSIAS